MTKDYGRKVGTALEAVRRLHADTSRLLRDCDATIGSGRESVFRSEVTKDLTWHVQTEFWMAEGVYRYYEDKAAPAPGVVEALTVCFFDVRGRVPEPFLLVGRFRYRVDPATGARAECKGWDLWYSYLDWWADRSPGVVQTLVNPDDRIERVSLVGVPLYDINSLGDVERLFEQVRAAAS